jgi:carboxypeptidase PM20D1
MSDSRTNDNEAVHDPARAAAEHLAALIRIPTVSSRHPGEEDAAVFGRFEETLAASYPRVHSELVLEPFGGNGLLFRWPGSSGDEKHPVVLMAHYDVVPVTGLPLPIADVDAEAPGWSEPPFAGVVRDGVVWGRGTLDDKGSLVIVLEAVEALLADGFRPARDVYLSFGHNEEVSGDGAVWAVEFLRRRGVRPWLVLDEGGAVVSGAMPGIKVPTAVVGLAEKGTLDVSLTVRDLGGHASTPPRCGATARLARAIVRIEKHPFPVRLTPAVLALFDTLGRHAKGPLGPLFRRARGLAPALARVLPRLGPEMNALVRTTAAITQLEGSPGANVLATTARAHANIRIATGETVDGTVARLRRIIHDPSVELTVVQGEDPSPVSPAAGPQWDVLEASVRVAYPDAITTPYLQLGASDSRHYCAIAEHVYRFSPLAMSTAQREAIHGTDEHVAVAALGRGVAFYEALIRAV